MTIFNLEENRIKVSTEALLVPKFGIIWDRDKSKDKHKAIAELTYVYFMADYKSFYNSIPEDSRSSVIMIDIFKEEAWSPDDVVKAAITKYQQLQETPTLRMLAGARKAQEAITKYYEGVSTDPEKVNFKSVGPIAMSLEKMGKIAESIDKLEDKIRREIQAEGRSKADRVVNKFEM